MEALQKMSDPKLIDCPACAKPSLRKQLTTAAFKLNGTGWYETDFKNSGAKPASKSPDNSAAESGSKPSAESGSEPTSSAGDSAVSSKTDSKASVASGDTA